MGLSKYAVAGDWLQTLDFQFTIGPFVCLPAAGQNSLTHVSKLPFAIHPAGYVRLLLPMPFQIIR